MRKKNGFTLVELIVSIALVLLLFTLVVPGVTSLVRQSRIKQCEQIKETILNAADLYVTEHKSSFSADRSFNLSSLYSGNYIDEEYEIEINNSKIKKGKWVRTGVESEISINVTRNKVSNDSNYSYYTYTIGTDFCVQ